MKIEAVVAQECHTRFAQEICDEIYKSSLERKTGIAKRTPEYICEKIRAGKAVIALSFARGICDEICKSSLERKAGNAKRTPEYVSEKIRAGKAVIALSEDGEFAGFSYIESWGGKSFVANSGLIVAHKFRGMGVAKMIKKQTFILSRKLFPDAKIFSITTGAAVMKMNYEFGFRPVPFVELTDDPEFWKGCQGCRHFDILKSHDYKMCICTGLLYDPKEHLEIHHPDEQ